MSEYIVDMYCESSGVKCEPIVRCRDCKYCDAYKTRWTNSLIHECLAEWCEGSEGDHPLVNPNDFCSYGKRKEKQEV